LKAGDSFIRSLIQTEIASSTIDRMKGMRQPQAAKSVSPRMVRTLRITTRESSSPSVAVV
jgi:hypothetical protein